MYKAKKRINEPPERNWFIDKIIGEEGFTIIDNLTEDQAKSVINILDQSENQNVIQAAIQYTYKQGTSGSDCDLQNTVRDAGLLNPVKDSYPYGECPDCGKEIPNNVKEGQECQNCGHVFYSKKE